MLPNQRAGLNILGITGMLVEKVARAISARYWQTMLDAGTVNEPEPPKHWTMWKEEARDTLSALNLLDGSHVVVPVEPTEAMLHAGEQALKKARNTGRAGGQTIENTMAMHFAPIKLLYQAMITAGKEG